MQFQGFHKSDFEVFHIDGLDERMEAIRGQIQPKFKHIGESLSATTASLLGNEMFLHIAKHARRKVNPPKDTWLAVCHDKRGYKKHPHFQVGLFDDHVFIWLAFIYELPNKKDIAEELLKNNDELFDMIPKDYVISMDHMKKDALLVKDMSKEDLENCLIRFRDVKKAEFLVGRHIQANDPLLANGEMFMKMVESTIETVIPIYKMALSGQKTN